MTSWTEFSQAAPRIAEIFLRRHSATGNLCLLGGEKFDHLFKTHLVGAAAVEVSDHLDVTMWREGDRERVVRKD